MKILKIKNKYCITCGESVIKRFKTENKAIMHLEKYGSFYGYWSNSASVSTENSNKITIEA